MKSLFVAALLLTGGILMAQAPDRLTDNPTYKKHCAKCHGKNATGRHFGGPSLQSDKTAAMSALDLRDIITNGKHRMPKFQGKLPPDEIDTLVREIQALNNRRTH